MSSTRRRIMACAEGRWLSWWHGRVRQVIPDLDGLTVTLLFDDDRPTTFQGPAAPWLAVHLVHTLYQEILQVPEMAELDAPRR